MAASRTSTRKSIEPSREILDCSICLEQFRTPRSLPCLHTFCEECLGLYISSQESKTDFPCPVCRSTVLPPNPKSSKKSWAGSFPLNHLIVTLMDEGSKGKDFVKCTMCYVRDDSSVTAIYWCNDCREGLCEKCYSYHQKTKVRSRHSSSLIEETGVPINPDVEIDEDCPRHRGKVLEVYCSDHLELCCVICFATKHRECKHITSIDDVSEEFDVKEVCSAFFSEMAEITRETKSIVALKEKDIENVGTKVKTIAMEITQIVDVSKDRLDYLRKSLIDNMKHKYETEKQKVEEKHKYVHAFENDVKNCCKVITSVSSGTRRQAFVMFEKIKSELSSHFQQLRLEMAGDVDLNLKFNMNSSLVSLVTLESLGEVDMQKAPSRRIQKILTQMARHLSRFKHPSYLVDPMHSNIKLVKSVTKEDVGLGQVNLAGGTFLQDGRLLIADFSSKRLIVFGEEFDDVTTLSVSGQPTDVALHINDGTEIVCKKLSGDEVFRHNVGKPVDGIAVDQDGNAYVVYENKDRTGSVYQTPYVP
ncbi:E3 ubiquitin-protein ligase TRIM56-like [Ylistrum balloti]|uniref:E3 ubiquitin-protein ligase TRIM56-like n=1 Tax=Ylistrum balloti TaxID=509963 RepID=UPI00290592F9|nr:E3 ubiquitin-protein ligase TRIM56-like [Ylistrum balloti]